VRVCAYNEWNDEWKYACVRMVVGVHAIRDLCMCAHLHACNRWWTCSTRCVWPCACVRRTAA